MKKKNLRDRLRHKVENTVIPRKNIKEDTQEKLDLGKDSTPLDNSHQPKGKPVPTVFIIT